MLRKKFQSSTSCRHAHGDCGEGITYRLSNLPEEVAHHVLSFLHFKDLVQVGTVSKGCLKFYLSVPSANFDAVVKTNQKRVEL